MIHVGRRDPEGELALSGGGPGDLSREGIERQSVRQAAVDREIVRRSAAGDARDVSAQKDFVAEARRRTGPKTKFKTPTVSGGSAAK